MLDSREVDITRKEVESCEKIGNQPNSSPQKKDVTRFFLTQLFFSALARFAGVYSKKNYKENEKTNRVKVEILIVLIIGCQTKQKSSSYFCVMKKQKTVL